MEQAVAYFPGFGVKLWVALQDLESVRPFYVLVASLTIRRSMRRIIARMMKPTWLRVRFS